MIHTDSWTGCYDNGWKGIICDEAFSHPAKYARGLITRIIKHVLEEGLIQPGGLVVDPFGGVGLGAWACMQNGLNWVGVELESKFVELGQANIDLWNSRYAAHFPRWGSARLLQGDSRRLAEVVAAAGCIVSSPPYAESLHINESPKKELKRMKERGLDSAIAKASRNGEFTGDSNKGYGQTPGQLAALPPGQPPAGLVSSPPFAGNTGGRGEASRNGIDAALFDRHSGGMKRGTGSDPANLDHLRMGSVGAVVGSPPFENQIPSQASVEFHQKRASIGVNNSLGRGDYGNAEGQLGNDSGETFWTAARTILNQCALLLPPGAPAVWVTKRYVKGGKIVEFSQQWAQLCEACGFEVVHWHRAMLVKDNGTQADIFGNGHKKTVARKSFFRRLAEAKGSPAIDFEDVICTVRR